MLRYFVLIFMLPTLAFATTASLQFSSESDRLHYQHLINELRCLVCQNQAIADSNAPLAEDLRREVYDHVIHGHTEADIKQYLTKRYGDFILYNPPIKTITYPLWLIPVLLLAIGAVIFMLLSRRGTQAPKLQLAAEQQRRLRDLIESDD